MAVAAPTFTGFRPEAIQFLVDLTENNDRSWFQPRKGEYEQLLKEPLEALISTLSERFAARGIPLRADPSTSPFRIYRDVRFSKDKSPYKTQVAASFPFVEGGDGATSHSENHSNPGGYFHLAPGNVYIGGGVWHPEPSWIKGFRDAIVDDYDGFRTAVEDPAFVEAFGAVGDDGDSLKRVPPGYPADHSAADLLRKKNVTFGRRLSDDDAFSPALPDILADAFAIGTPLLRYLASVEPRRAG
jgi:uncharacterized protein (TIGR02453 family)